MEFSDKLSNLMILTGISNSKLAKALSIDPSLVSRWRNGSRRPTQHSDAIVRLSAHLAGHVSTAHHRTLLAGLLTDRSLLSETGDALFEAILRWLNDSGTLFPNGRTAAPCESPAPLQVFVNSAYIGDAGRRFVSERMLRHFDKAAPAQTIRLYSNTPLDWIADHTRHRDAELARLPDLFDNVSQVKLLMNSTIGEEEMVRLLEYLLPFLRTGTLQIAQIPRYRAELFTHTINVAGDSVAAVSYGFSGGGCTTNLFTDAAFIHRLSVDFDALFARCETVHTTSEDITLPDILEAYQQMLLGSARVAYIGNCIPPILVERALLCSIAGRAHAGMDKTLREEGLLACCAESLDGFLSRSTFQLHLPLFGVRDAENGAACVSGIPQPACGRPLITPEETLQILQHLGALLDRYPNLLLNPIEALPHDHGLLVQSGAQVFAIRQRQPFVGYNAKFSCIVRALDSLIVRRHGGTEALRAKQPQARAALDAHIMALRRP